MIFTHYGYHITNIAGKFNGRIVIFCDPMTIFLASQIVRNPPFLPEQTLLYQIVEQHYPEFRDVMAAQGKSLPIHVQQEFSEYLKCGRLEHGFLRVQCTECHHEHSVGAISGFLTPVSYLDTQGYRGVAFILPILRSGR